MSDEKKFQPAPRSPAEVARELGIDPTVLNTVGAPVNNPFAFGASRSDAAAPAATTFSRGPMTPMRVGPAEDQLARAVIGPPFLRGVKLSGGEKTLGVEVRGEHLVPAWVESHGDLIVEEVGLKRSLAPAPMWLIRALFDAAPRRDQVQPSDDPEVRARCIAAAKKEIRAGRDFILHRQLLRRDESELRYFVEELHRYIAQRYALDEGAFGAREVLASEWRERFQTGKFSLIHPLFPGLDANVQLAHTSDPRECLYYGVPARAIEDEVHAAHATEAQVKGGLDAERVRLESLHEITPREAGVIVVRRPSNGAPAPLTVDGPVLSSYRDGWEIRTFVRPWPGDIAMPRAATIQGNAAESWEVIGDDDTFTLSGRDIERGQRMHAPRSVLDAIMQARRARVNAKEPIAAFVNMTTPREAKRSLKAYRAYLEGPGACIFNPSEHAEASYLACAVAFGVVACSLDPIIVSNEIAACGKSPQQRRVFDLIELGYSIASAPQFYIFRIGEALAGKTSPEENEEV